MKQKSVLILVGLLSVLMLAVFVPAGSAAEPIKLSYANFPPGAHFSLRSDGALEKGS